MGAKDYIEAAVELAVEAVHNGWGGPFGAVIVRDGEVIARGQNRVLLTGDPTAHAEIVAIRDAVAAVHPAQLELVPRPAGSSDPAAMRARMLMGCEIYTTGAPCPMCMGAIYWARLDRVHYSSGVDAARAAGFSDEFIYEDLARPEGERSIPLCQVHPELGMRPYQAWMDKPDRHPY